MLKCPTCCSAGFEPSTVPGRCTFCDGTEGGNPPAGPKPAVILYVGIPSARDMFVLSQLEAAYLDRGLIVEIQPDYVIRPELRPAAGEMVWFEEEAEVERGQMRRFMVHVDELPVHRIYGDNRASKNKPWYRSFDKRNKGF